MVGADAPVPAAQAAFGTQQGTFSPLNPYLREFRHFDPAVAGSRADRLDITATNISSIAIDPRRAGVTCKATLNVVSDGPLDVRLLGCGSKSFDGDGTGQVPASTEPIAMFGTPDDPSPFVGGPLPAEFGDKVPQPPLYWLPPMRFPPNFSVPFNPGSFETPPL